MEDTIDIVSPPIEADNEVPKDTLVCDLHYEKSWDARRRYEISCKDVTKYTLPCTGTYACICKHSDKEFYKVSKTLPVVPKTYTGLTTSLAEVWIDPVIIIEEEIEEEGPETLIIIIVSAIVGSIIICCVISYFVAYCAQRKHSETY